MKRLNNSDFESLQSIIENLNITCNETEENLKEELFGSWEEIIGNKISKFSKIYEISADNVLTVLCADSFVANELYFEKDKIFLLIEKKAKELGIKIKDIKFDYKKWKETDI